MPARSIWRYRAFRIFRIGRVCDCEIFRLMIPSRHLLLDIEHPRSGISGLGNVGDHRAELCGLQPAADRARRCGNAPHIQAQRSQPLVRAWAASVQSGFRRSRKRIGRRFSSTDRSVRSVPSKLPSLTTRVGYSEPAMTIFGRVSQARPTTCAAVMNRPFPR